MALRSGNVSFSVGKEFILKRRYSVSSIRAKLDKSVEAKKT
jgi:hypothetical protein